MRRLLMAVCALMVVIGGGAAVISCDDDDGTSPDAGQVLIDAAADTGFQEDAARANAATLCVDRPGELPRPPAGILPCDLIPPGLSL